MGAVLQLVAPALVVVVFGLAVRTVEGLAVAPLAAAVAVVAVDCLLVK